MLAKKTSKNQITIPKAIVDRIPGVEYFDVTLRGGDVVLKPAVLTTPGERLRVMRARIKAMGLTEKNVQAAIRWARGRRP